MFCHSGLKTVKFAKHLECPKFCEPASQKREFFEDVKNIQRNVKSLWIYLSISLLLQRRGGGGGGLLSRIFSQSECSNFLKRESSNWQQLLLLAIKPVK